MSRDSWEVSPHYGEWLVWSKKNKKKPSSQQFPYIATVYSQENAVLIKQAPLLLDLCKEILEEKKASESWLKKVEKIVEAAESKKLE